MDDFGDNNRIRARRKSERIAKKISFSNFTNTMENPVDVDAEAPVEIGKKVDKSSMRLKVKIPVRGESSAFVQGVGKEIKLGYNGMGGPTRGLNQDNLKDEKGKNQPPLSLHQRRCHWLTQIRPKAT